MKIFLTGISGHLGLELYNTLTMKGSEVYGTYLRHKPNMGNIFRIDLANREDALSLIKKIRPDYIVHCAALSSVEFCEMNREEAWNANVISTKNVSDACKMHNIGMVFISTDYVFDGKKGFYSEDNTTNPINFYGKTKLIGEWLTRNVPLAVVVRTSTLLSHKPGSYVDTILRGLESKSVKGATDLICSPTLTTELAEGISKLIYKNFSEPDTYHMAGDMRISRYDLAKTIAMAFDHDPEIVKPTTAEGLGFKAPRPKDTSLNISKAKSIEIRFSKIEDAIRKLKASNK